MDILLQLSSHLIKLLFEFYFVLKGKIVNKCSYFLVQAFVILGQLFQLNFCFVLQMYAYICKKYNFHTTVVFIVCMAF